MGCTSSKPKRTKSLDDIQAGIKGPAVNGQVTKDDSAAKKISNGEQTQATNPIQIPGSHRSFLAPDGIPFIDEDIEEDDVRSKAEVNKHPVDATTKNNSALVNVVVEEKRLSDAIRTAATTGDQVEITVNTKGAVPTSELQMVNRSKSDEEEAAIKIQAGVRGFLDRKKVHHIKENLAESHVKIIEGEKEPVVVVFNPKYDEDTAATKIQANYKGYRTRKQMHINAN